MPRERIEVAGIPADPRFARPIGRDAAAAAENMAALGEAIKVRAHEHQRTPMIGRTHGVHAEPMTFGLKLALWYAELARDRDRLVRARVTIAAGFFIFWASSQTMMDQRSAANENSPSASCHARTVPSG